jgi:hypothetical protein
MRRIRSALVISLFAFASTASAGGKTAAKAPAKAAPAKAAPAPKAPVKKAGPPVNAEHKKALAELYAGYKFGMTKDEVVKTLSKKIDERYEDKIKATTDIAAQDRIRKDKKRELAEITKDYVEFQGTKTGWDVSIIDGEFAHKTGEAMMDQWEKEGSKNQRRFFFFYQGKLWKMYVSLDLSILPEDKKNFETFAGVMSSKYGPPSDTDPGVMTWRAGEFDVRAVDRLKDYDTLGLVIEDSNIKKQVEADRARNAPAAKETPSIIKAVIDTDHKDHPGVKENDGAVNAVIQANGGGGSAPKK